MEAKRERWDSQRKPHTGATRCTDGSGSPTRRWSLPDLLTAGVGDRAMVQFECDARKVYEKSP